MTTDYPEPPSTGPPCKRRRWQFGLSTLLLVVATSAVVCWWFARRESPDDFKRRFTDKVNELGGSIIWGGQDSPSLLSFSRPWSRISDDKLLELRDDLGRLGPFTLEISHHSLHRRVKITDAGLQHLDRASQLECLCLWGNDITDAGLHQLLGLQGLQFVDLRHTKITSAGVTQAARQRPDLFVFHDLDGPSKPSIKAAFFTTPEGEIPDAPESVRGPLSSHCRLAWLPTKRS